MADPNELQKEVLDKQAGNEKSERLLAEVLQTLNVLSQKSKEQFETLDARLNALEEKFAKGQKWDEYQKRLDALDEGFEKLAEMDKKMTGNLG